MSDLLATLINVLRAAGPWLGPALALAAFAEAIVLIGFFVPITALLLLSGAAIGGGLIAPGLLPWVMCGAFAGGVVSYELGRALRRQGRSQPQLPAGAQKVAERLISRHGAAAVVVARFLGPPATVAPFLAGWSQLDRTRFLAANFAASILWPPMMLAAGFASGWLAARHGI